MPNDEDRIRPVSDNVGAIVKARREELSLSQERVAYAAQIEQTELSKIERGKKQPTVALARRLASALHLPSDALLDSNPSVTSRLGAHNDDQNAIG